jgi:hypothetical protein
MFGYVQIPNYDSQAYHIDNTQCYA